MTRFDSVHALADAVLEAVAKDARTKVASVTKVARPKYVVPTARDLRKLADDLRNAPEDEEVGLEDIDALRSDPEVMQLLDILEANPELLAQILDDDDGEAGAEDLAEEEAAADAVDVPPVLPVPEEGDVDPEEALIAAEAAKEASASRDLRKMAHALRKKAARTVPTRIKAAATLYAATGIQHLVGGGR